MAEKSIYGHVVEPQGVDFTLRATVTTLGQYMLNTAGKDAQSKGFGSDVLTLQGKLWVLSRMTMEILSRPEQYTEFGLATWVSANNRILSTRNFELRDRDGRAFLNSVSQWCLIDVSTRLPLSLAEAIPSLESYVCTDPEPCQAPRRLREAEYETSVRHRVKYSDIDFNCHVNTMRYITMMTDLLPLEFHSGNLPMRLDINFQHESTFGQMLEISHVCIGEMHKFAVKNLDDGTVSALAEIQML